MTRDERYRECERRIRVIDIQRACARGDMAGAGWGPLDGWVCQTATVLDAEITGLAAEEVGDAATARG